MPANCGLGKALDNRIRDFKAERELAFRFALVNIEPSGGNTGDSASDLRAIDKRLQDDKGRAINKAIIAQMIRESLIPGERRPSIKPELKTKMTRGKIYRQPVK